MLSAEGMAHIMNGLPIRGPIDLTLSDQRLPSAPKERAYVSKPYSFMPGAFGTTGIFGGEGISALAEADKKKQKAAAPTKQAG